jgi:hypothetical protein
MSAEAMAKADPGEKAQRQCRGAAHDRQADRRDKRRKGGHTGPSSDVWFARMSRMIVDLSTGKLK